MVRTISSETFAIARSTPCVASCRRWSAGLSNIDLSRPLILDPHKVVEVDSRVEHRVQKFGDGAVECVVRREADRLRGEEVEP